MDSSYAGVKNLILDRYDLSYGGRGSNAFFLSPEQNGRVKEIVEESLLCSVTRMCRKC